VPLTLDVRIGVITHPIVFISITPNLSLQWSGCNEGVRGALLTYSTPQSVILASAV